MMNQRNGHGEDPDLRALAREGPVHFVGVAGAGVSALAELVLRSGGRVTGCDVDPDEVADSLGARGAEIHRGHDPAHVEDAVAVVTTSAVPSEHPELSAARGRGVPVLKRAEALGAIVNRGRVVAIAGTHGKTTTTAMTAAILAEAGLDPTAFVGARVPGWGGGLRLGSEELFVVEADEYDRSFLTLRPSVAVVTTVEPDHLDVYETESGVEQAFDEFVSRVRGDGLIAACVDDPGARRVLDRVEGDRALGYGTIEEARLRASDVQLNGLEARFRVWDGTEDLGRVAVRAPGLHNVKNALAALAAARRVGANMEAARRALAEFRGVGRRFEVLGEADDVVVVDDYAHHPTEVEATLAAARRAWPERRLIAVFQPHLYSRTQAFAEAFARALEAADVAWVSDVYPAREEPIPGVTGELVAEAIRAAPARYEPDLDELGAALARALRPGDVCLTLGAGNIDDVARAVLARRGGSAEEVT